MPTGPAGVKIEDLQLGNGIAATREHQALVTYMLFLNRGECVQDVSAAPMWIDLGRRETIAGLRYGIEGMAVGGRRRIAVPPHLGYGAAGVPGTIPSNAVLIFETCLLELRAR